MERKDTARVILTAAVIVLLGVFLAGSLAATFCRLGYGFNLDYAESHTVANAVYIQQGRGLYRGMRAAPYIVPPYTPLYYYLIAPFATSFQRVLFAGRLVSFGCFLAVGALVFSAVRRRSGGLAIPAVSSGFLLTSYVLFIDSSLAQINLPGLLFSVLGVWLLGEKRNKALALVAFLLAVFTKQSMLAGMVAACVWIGIAERPSRGFLYFCAFGIITGAFFLALNVFTGGNFFLSAFKCNVNPMIPRLAINAYKGFFLHYSVLIVIAILGLSWRRPNIWQVYFLAGLLFAAASAKEGSGSIYFAEPLVGLLVSFGCAMGRLNKRPGKAYAVILLLVIAQIALTFPESGRRLRDWRGLPCAEEGLRELSAMVRSAAGPVLTETADLSFAGGKDYFYQGPGPRFWNKEEGRYSPFVPPELLRNIAGRRFSLIAEYYLYRNREPALMELIKENYYEADKTYPSPLRTLKYRVWFPREGGA